MLILSNTEYAIIINIIEYINTTYSPVVSFYAYVSFLKIFSLTSRVRLSVKKTRIFCRHKTCSLENLKKNKNHCTHHLLLKVFCQTRYRGRLCVPFVRLGNTQHICLQWCSVHLHGEILGIRTCADVTHLSNICLSFTPWFIALKHIYYRTVSWSL